MNALLVVDKPTGWTSHDVVARVRRLLGEKSVGHLGTLDPMASGVLPLVLGRLTRIAQFYGDSVKAYEGEIRFGFATTTYDAEGEAIAHFKESAKSTSLSDTNVATSAEPATRLCLEDIRETARKFTGKLLQTPPPYSAKKINGVPAYKLARQDKPVKLEPVEVEISEFEIVGGEGDRATFRAVVSSGTYVRCIAHELGIALGTGAHLTALRRTRVADFTIADSRTMEEIEAAAANPEGLFIHPRRVLAHMPAVTATEEQTNWIRNGRAVNLLELSRAKLIRVYSGQRDLIAIMSRVAGTLFHPKVVLMGGNEGA